MARPRLLLVAQLSELEWRIKPLLEEWADVASYDAPGVGDEPRVDPLDMDALVAHALDVIDRRGWDRCFIAGDEYASAIAVLAAAARPDAVQGLALGHACLTYDDEGPDPTIDGAVMAGFYQLMDTDYRSWVRAYTQLTLGAYDDETMDRFIERVPADIAPQLVRATTDHLEAAASFEPLIRDLRVPLLFAEHRGCIAYRPTAYAAAAEAFPAARTVSTTEKPNCSPAFAEALRSFCHEPAFAS
jgi:pimeloyl-ACP methyl ester carboxylesterase